MFIYIELNRSYKSIFKLNINYSNSHIVQDERKEISCESPLAWRHLDAALPVVQNLQKYRYILENIDGVFIDFS